MKSILKHKNCWLLLFSVFAFTACEKSSNDNDNNNPPTTDQYFTWNVTGNSGSITIPPDSLWVNKFGTSTIIIGESSSFSKQARLSFPAQATGTYTTNHFYVYVNNKMFVQPSAQPLQVNVTSYGPAGQYIIGTYSGTVKDSLANTMVSINGQFRVKNQ